MAVASFQWLTTARYQLALLAFFGFVNVYMLRVNLSVALVAMVDTSTDNLDNNTTSECPVIGNDTSSHDGKSTGDTYKWDRSVQGLILGSFFYGYIVTQIPAGWLAGRYGGKKLLGLGVFFTAVLTLLTPLAAKLGVPALVAIRILEGLGEGVAFPAMHAMWAVWAPPLERSKLVMLTYAGAQLGTVIGLPLSGLIANTLGWPYIFYIFGVIGIFWFILWMIFVSDTPAVHRFISKSERDYITSEVAKTAGRERITLSNTPWLAILKSPAVWAASCAHFCHNWGYYTLLTCLPTYMKDVLHFDLSKDSLLSSLPYLFMWIFVMLTGVIVDTVRERKIVTTTFARKFVTIIGFLVPAASLSAIGYVGCDYTLAVVLLCISGTFDGISQSGFNVNHLDIAPKYGGTLMGITNTFATIPGFLGPQVVGWLTTVNSTSEQWRSVFFVSAGVYVFGVIVYSVFGSGEVQPWAVHGGYEPLASSERLLERDEDEREDGYQTDNSVNGSVQPATS